MIQPAQAGQGDGDSLLPELRPELSIERGAASRDSGGGWVIYDPVRHRHYQIDQTSYELLALWSQCATAEALTAAAAERFGATVSSEQIDDFVKFLEINQLCCEPRKGGWRQLATEANKKPEGWSRLMKLAHDYLFFRVPLFRPQRFLIATLPLIAPFYTRIFALVVGLMGLCGLYLVSRQWGAFLKTTDYFFTWEGLAWFGVSLLVLKAFHELGHAYTAVRYGCYVPTVGVAFMLLTPLLYTDVSDSWRLANRRKRLWIDSAGIIVEVGIACIATFLWAFLPDGPVRSSAFMLATAGWLMSLAINLNPFMRFDGYYLFSELIGIENLQSRAFALARWRLREVLFGLGRPCPEALPPRIVNTLVIWGWATWVYRLMLFIGIAILVYNYCFKVLGILLFILEIGLLVAKPVYSELKEWYAMRREILASSRAIASAVVAASLAVIVIVPWSQTVMVPSVLELHDARPIHAKRPALIRDVHVVVGQRVEDGDPMFTLTSDEIENQVRKVKTELQLTVLRLGRTNVDDIDREEALVLKRRYHALITELKGLEKERGELTIKAPMSGRVLELDPVFHAGRSVRPSDRLALVGRGAHLEVIGFINEDDIWRVQTGRVGSFIPDSPLTAAIPVRLRDIAITGSSELDIPSLASVYGGPIAVEQNGEGKLIPSKGQYLAAMDVVRPPSFQGTVLRGMVHLEGSPESLLAKFWRRTLNVLVRESGA